MPSATDDMEADQVADQVLASEREHLIRAREYLRLMREDVLALPALAGDHVSEQYLKRDLYRRVQSLRDLPDAPLFFGRLDYAAAPDPAEVQANQAADARPGTSARSRDMPGEAGPEFHDGEFHIGRRHVHDPHGHPAVIDWRAPVSRPFYRASQAEPMGLTRRRRFGFSGGDLTAFEDESFGQARPRGAEPGDGAALSRLVIEEIERPRSGSMRDIVATIQPEQDDIVRADAIESAGAPIRSHSARCSTSAILASPLSLAAFSLSAPRTGTEAISSVTDSWAASNSPSAGSTLRM